MQKIQSFLKLPFQFDVKKLQTDLDCVCQNDWVPHPNINAYDGLWLISSLTSVSGKTKDIVAFENVAYQNTPLLEKTKYLKSVLESFQTKIEAVRFMRLGVNSTIKEHCDKGSCFEEGYARLHIPITTNDDTYFTLSRNKYKMEIGNCYYIDAHNPHSVVNNNSYEERVHLLIDCHVNEWFKEVFKKAGFVENKQKYTEKSINDNNIDEIINNLKHLNSPVSEELIENLLKQKENN